MRRAALLFGAGLLSGALATYFLAGGDAGLTTPVVRTERDTMPPPAFPAPAPHTSDFLELVMGSIDTTERAALYRLAAQADRATLEASLKQVAALPKLASRATALELLLSRYGEIDPAAAAALARELALEATVVAPMFESWARRDASAALRALGATPEPTATQIGIALLRVVGNDDLGIIRVLGAAPQINADGFRVEAAVAKAATAPEAAVEDALLLSPSRRATALARIAGVWVKNDAHGAIAHVDYIDDVELKNAFNGALLRDWAAYDPEAMLAYIVDLPPDEQDDLQAGAVQALTLLEPERALAAAESFTGQFATMMRRAALLNLARDDALAALRHIEALPAGGDRDQLRSVIAQTYGRTDPTAAIAWAQNTAPEQLTNVMMGVARADPQRAIDMLLTLPGTTEQQRMTQALVMNNALSSDQTAALAERLLAQEGRGSALQMLTGAWSQRAPQEALNWLLAHRGPATTRGIAQAGMNLARTNPSAAVGYLDRIPGELRASWISAVADGYAQKDAVAAAGWIAQYRGQAGYDAAVAAIAERTARHDPVAAARLFDLVDVAQAPDAPGSARTIAASWARRDAPAAASWARGLTDDDAAGGAVGAVVSQWVTRDAAAARTWVASLPRAAARDAALVQILGATAGTPAADTTLLDAFSSAAAQQRGVNQAIRIIAARDVEAARQLADQYLPDPGTRQAAERYIEQGASSTIFLQRPPRIPAQR
jgi:hypothetical protein